MAEHLSPEILADCRQLFVLDLQRQLPGVPTEEPIPLSMRQIGRLMTVASRLAFSDAPEDRTLAYDLVTRAVFTSGVEMPRLNPAADFILARLGNFPGRRLLRERRDTGVSVQDGMSALLRMEAFAREAENTTAAADGEPLSLTDFQFELLELLETQPAISVSAPTSAGKSFIFALEVTRRLKARRPASIVYVVPTRALIRQVMLLLREELAKAQLSETPVRCVPAPLARADAPNGIVYVLTQERLLGLLNSEDGDPWITAIIVDEAQSIRDGSRGVLLHSAIDLVNARFPGAEIFFASPLAKNPEYLLTTFARNRRGRSYTERVSPVSQNVVLLSPVRREGVSSDVTTFELLSSLGRIPLGERSLPFTLRDSGGVLVRRALFAKAIAAKDGCCLVYANGARDAERLAELLVANEPSPPAPEPELRDFIKFLGDFIHPEYALIGALRHRVAFHYGNMPGSVRSTVEDLAKDGKLRFVCCTSTLLQGVNLPARDIVVENPERGRGQAMERGDFLNLAGRAGRLLKEFQGNVWCLRPERWESQCFQGEALQEMKSAFESALADGGTLLQRVLDGTTRSDDDIEMGVAAVGKVFTEFVQPGRPLGEEPFALEAPVEMLRGTVGRLERLQAELTLPGTVFRRNATVLPTRLESLYKFFQAQQDLEEWIPLPPFHSEMFVRLREIFRLVQQELENDQSKRYLYHWVLGLRWIRHWPLRRIIESRVSFLQRRGEASVVGDVIIDTIETLESAIRFRYVRNMRAYNDVLAIALRERDAADLADNLAPLAVFLECGASHPVAIALITLGLSRTAALLLRDKILFRSDTSPEECLAALRRLPLRRMGLPPTVVREIERLVKA